MDAIPTTSKMFSTLAKSSKKSKKRKHSPSPDEPSSKIHKIKSKKKCKKSHKHSKQKKHKKDKEKLHKEKTCKGKTDEEKSTEEDSSTPTKEPMVGPSIPIEIIEKAKKMAPMSKEEWETQQNKIQRVYDEVTGRTRLIKGEGEVLEECVSRKRHQEINRDATRGDGAYFQSSIKKHIQK